MTMVACSEDGVSAEEPAQVFGEELDDLHMRLWDVFAKTATNHPGREAIVSLWQQPQEPTSSSSSSPSPPLRGDQSDLRWTYAHLKDRAERLAESLENLGCGPGMRLAAALWNSAEWGLFFWATAKLGMTFVPVDPTVPHDARDMVSSVRPHVVVVQDADDAARLDLDLAEAHLSQPRIRIQCSGLRDVEGWMRLRQVSPSFEPWKLVHAEDATADGLSQMKDKAGTDDDDDGDGDDDDGRQRVALIVFTSGTTGTPKGCPHTERNLISQTCDFDPEPDPSCALRWLVHTPVSHIFAVNNMLRAWRYGGAVVFPSKAFDVGATLKALVQEQCSIMSATPTLVKALLAHPAFPSPKDLCIRLVTIGGTTVGPDDIRLCREGLGARHAIQAYGMSEGAPVISWRRPDPDLVDGYHPGVGKVLPGAAARVCRPRSRDVLRRSEIGELHIGGPSVIERYVDAPDDALYRDGSGNWLATGDQAKIDEKGVIHILGRYKDIIIRGGENIYPSRIEAKLAEIPGLQAQVVAAPDDVAGQVPVAIVKLPDGTTKTQVSELARSLGPRHALDAVYSLEDLKLHSFPVTSLGKVKKERLRQAMAELRNASQPQPSEDAAPRSGPKPPSQSRSKPLADRLLDLWEQLSGTRPPKDESVVYLADSITLLRYCDSVLRSCGKRLYLQDFAENDTIEKQAQLLVARDQQQAHFESVQDQKMQTSNLVRNGACQIQRHTASYEGQASISAQELVARIGLLDTDVEDAFRVRESFLRMLKGQRPRSYQHRMVFRIRNVENAQIRGGLEKGLASRPLLRTIVCHPLNECPHHAVLSASPALYGHLIHESEVETEDDAAESSKDESEAAAPPGPFMFQANLVRVRETGSHYLSMTYNHSAVDALSLMPWHRDLDRLIRDGHAEMPALTPYRLFADLLSQYEESAPAQKCVSFHVARLRGISRFKRALWPPQRAPGWMISNDDGSPDADERRQVRDGVWEGQWETRASEFRYPRSCRVVRLPQLNKLRRTYGVDASLFAKSALVIFNVLQTGAPYALFNTWESGRSWPFVPGWMEKLLPPAMSIDGPTVQWILNMTEVMADETVAGFLRRMAHEQEQLVQHQHAPWDKVVQGLRDEGRVAVDASFRQSFVWDVSMGLSPSRGLRSDFTALEPVARYDWADCGLFWNAFMLDTDNLYFIASWDTAQMNDVEVEGHCDGLAAVMRRLADEGNWEKTIGEVFAR